MYMLKLLFQKVQIRPIWGSWENSRPPGALLKITAWGQVEASGPLCAREETDDHPPWLTAQDRNVAASFTESSLNLKALTLFIPCYKNIKTLAWKEKTRYMNPPSSRIAGHLNKAPLKIQSLSLLIGFGIDRQPKCWCLFRFHCLSPTRPSKQRQGLNLYGRFI